VVASCDLLHGPHDARWRRHARERDPALGAKARNPVRMDLLEQLGMVGANIHVGAVCVYHNLIGIAVEALGDSGIPVAAVSTGFPAGQITLDRRSTRLKSLVEGLARAKEIDIVISRANVLTEQLESAL